MRAGRGIAALALILPSAAGAQVTPEGLLADLGAALSESAGAEVSFLWDEEAGVLSIEGGGGRVARLSPVTLEEVGSGTVLSLPEAFALEIVGPERSETVLRGTGPMAITVSAFGGDGFDVAAAGDLTLAVDVAHTQLITGAAQIDTLELALSSADMSFVRSIIPDGARTGTVSIAVEQLDLAADVTEDGVRSRATSGWRGLRLDATLMLPASSEELFAAMMRGEDVFADLMADPATAAVTATLARGETTVEIRTVDGPPGPDDSLVASTSRDVTVDFALSDDRISYDGAASATELVLDFEDDPTMPAVPLILTADGLGIGFEAGVSDLSDIDIAYRLRLDAGRMGDEAWALVDPTGVFPREAFGYELAVEARIELPEGATVADLGTVSPERLMIGLSPYRITYGDAVLSSEGTVEITAPAEPAPIPVISGGLRLEASGLRPLLMALSRVEGVPPEAILGANAFLNGFMRAVGDDAFAADVSFSPDGTVTINGMPMETLSNLLR